METIVATRKTWKNHSIKKPKKISISLRFTEEEFIKIRAGLIPEEMEDKWFIFFEDNWLYCHRSWTGYGMYKAQIIKEGKDYLIMEFFAERDLNLYTNEDDDYDRGALTFLIVQGLLGIEARPAYLYTIEPSENNALKEWSMFGRMLFK